MSETCVWAYQPLPELDNRTGFVPCSQELATELIASGKVQDPRNGGNSLKQIGEGQDPAPVVTNKDEPPVEPKEPAEYSTKEIVPTGKKTKVVNPFAKANK